MTDNKFSTLSDIFPYGKFKGFLLCDVLAIDMSYFNWWQQNISHFEISESLRDQIIELYPDFNSNNLSEEESLSAKKEIIESSILISEN